MEDDHANGDPRGRDEKGPIYETDLDARNCLVAEGAILNPEATLL